jgi:hypothetical protein
VHAVIPAAQPGVAFAEMRRSGKTGKVLVAFETVESNPNT